jgi:hypothetical protein
MLVFFVLLRREQAPVVRLPDIMAGVTSLNSLDDRACWAGGDQQSLQGGLWLR